MSFCLEQDSYKNNQFSKYCKDFEKHSQLSPYKFTKWELIKVWLNRYKQRKALAKLDQRMLTDIGCTYQQASKEFEKPFWKN